MRLFAVLTLMASAGLTPALAVGISENIAPRPAQIMPLADRSLVLDVANTGNGFVAVGERGHILTSSDGQNWSQVPAPVSATLTAVSFANEKLGLAAGHDTTILRSTDGGRSWQLVNFEPVEDIENQSDEPFFDVLMLDAEKAWAVGAYGMLYRSNDGGQSWNKVTSPISAEEWHFNEIIQLNNGDLFLAGESGTLAISANDGESWQLVTSPYKSTLFTAAAAGPKGVVIGGLRGNLFISADPRQGQWRKLDTGTQASLIAATPLANGEILLVGINGIILRTHDQQQGVERLPNSQGATLAGVVPLSTGILAVGAAGPLIITFDTNID